MPKLLITAEMTLVVVASLLAFAWISDPTSNAERYLAAVAPAALLLEWARRRTNDSYPLRGPTSTSVAPNFGSVAVSVPRAEQSEVYLPSEQGSRALFGDRFSYAFPGVRGIAWFESREAVERLLILLAEPLKYNPESRKGPPFWWWRRGNLQIESFHQIDSNTVLMNWSELRIRRIAALPGRSYKWHSVYVECEGMPSVDLYEPLSDEDRRSYIKELGYIREEYAIFRGQKITRAEYDDGAARIAGKIVRLHGEAELRCRYLSPYNFVIAPLSSPINNNSFDNKLGSILNGMLVGLASVEQLSEAISNLPLPPRFE